MPKSSIRRAARAAVSAIFAIALALTIGFVGPPTASAQDSDPADPPADAAASAAPTDKVEDVAGPEQPSNDPAVAQLTVPSVTTDVGGSVLVAPVAETQGSGNNYQLLDSNDQGGPVPEGANSCSGTYAPVFAGGHRDDDEATVSLPWTMTFFGQNYNSVRVGVNGGMSFWSGEEVNFTNGDLGTSIRADHPAIYPFWDDLEFEFANPTTSNVFQCVAGPVGSRTIDIIWSGVDCIECADDENVTFKVKIFESNDSIEFHYIDVVFASGDPHNGGGSATIGIDSGDRSDGYTAYLQYSRDAFSVVSAHAIRFFIPTCDGRLATHVATREGSSIDGTGAADVLVGHLGSDVLRGFGGNDRLCGFGGADTLRAGPGNDIVFGGKGNDAIYGGGGSDLIIGGRGNDLVMGQGGSDDISGADDDDVLFGQGASDVVRGGPGNDVLRGSAGADQLFGGADTDQILGNIGPDQLYGGSGNDDLLGGEGNDDLTGDSGNDKCAGNTGSGDRAQAASCESMPAVEFYF